MQNKPQNQEMETMAQQQQKRKDFWKKKISILQYKHMKDIAYEFLNVRN